MSSAHRWVRCVGKRPVTVTGAPASSTDPSTWDAFGAVQRGPGDGYGVMLGDGLACWDLDHCIIGGALEPWAADILSGIEDPLWVEVSVSGTGLHVFVEAPEAPGSRSGKVEFYSRGRFIRVTGVRYDARGGSD